MATYLELFDLKNNDTVHHKVSVAVTKKAQSLLDSASPTTNQVAWASNALANNQTMTHKVMLYVLAANSGATVSQITSATDSAVQTNVDAAVNALIAGGVIS